MNKKIVKIITLTILILIIGIASVWFYATNEFTHRINDEFAGKKFHIKNFDQTEYVVNFKSANSMGFPFKIAWQIVGYVEESKDAFINYVKPINIGYNLLLQKIFVEYTGPITISYKSADKTDDVQINIKDYHIEVPLPLSYELLRNLKNKNFGAVLNHIDKILLSTQDVEIYTIADNIKFYDKKFEELTLSFTKPKKYIDYHDLLNDIPKEYKIKYQVKTDELPISFTEKIPSGLFYLFSIVPSGIDLKLDADIKTKANRYQQFSDDLSIDTNFQLSSTYLDIIDFNFSHQHTKSNTQQLGNNFTFKLKKDFFNQVFNFYNYKIKDKINNKGISTFLVNEIDYIIRNKEDFDFKSLEDASYNFSLNFDSKIISNIRYSKINDLSILSSTSGLKIQQNMQQKLRNNAQKTRGNFKFDGVLYLNNYPNIVDFTSGYIYRLGKFRTLNEEAKKLYSSVNKAFIKDISDYPKSSNNDLSFTYSFDLADMNATKLGSKKIEYILNLYNLTLYQQLFDKVGYEGDILSKIKKIIPSINQNDPLLKNLLPKSFKGSELEKKVKEAFKQKLDQNLVKKLIK